MTACGATSRVPRYFRTAYGRPLLVKMLYGLTQAFCDASLQVYRLS